MAEQIDPMMTKVNALITENFDLRNTVRRLESDILCMRQDLFHKSVRICDERAENRRIREENNQLFEIGVRRSLDRARLQSSLEVAYEALQRIATLPEQGGCGDDITAVELWLKMRAIAKDAILAVKAADVDWGDRVGDAGGADDQK